MYRWIEAVRGIKVGKCALVALLTVAALCVGAAQAALGQAPGAVFSHANGISGIDNHGDRTGPVNGSTASHAGDSKFTASSSASGTSRKIVPLVTNSTSAIFSNAGYVTSVNSSPGLTSPDYQGSAGHLAANSRGDVFFDDAPYSYPNTAYLVEIPAAGGPQVTLLSNLGYGASAVYADAGGNLWAADPNSNVIYLPLVNGSYPAGGNASKLSSCSAPISSNVTPCKFYWQLGSSVGYYVQPSDVALDGSGNVYVVDKYDGSTNGGKNRILQFTGSTGAMTILVDGLPSSGGAQLAVDAGGDVYYADGNGAYFFAASSFPTTTGTTAATSVGSGLSNPTGVSLDDGGNLYISDTGHQRILEIPYESGALNSANQYTLIDNTNNSLTNSGNISSVHAQDGVGIDGYGRIYYVGNYGNSINYLHVGYLNLGSTAIGTPSGASTINLYFTRSGTFGSFAVLGAAGASGPFALGSNNCTVGQQYAEGATCAVNVTYTASAAGVQSGSLQALDNSGNLLGEAMLTGSGTAATLNVDPGTVSAVGSGWTSPSAITVDGAGNTYVADSSTGKIYKTAAGGTTPTAIASGFSNPSAVAVDGAGNLYVGDSGNGQVVEVPILNGLYGTPLVLQTGLSGASGLALDSLGDLYIADSGNARVLLLTRSGNLAAGSLVTTVGSGFTTPVAVAIDNAGNLYVSDSAAGSVVQVAIPTGQQSTILSGLKTAAGVGVDAGGDLYAADAGSGVITRVPSIGGIINKNYESQLGSVVAQPDGIALDSAGNLYVTDAADAVVAEDNRATGLLSFGTVNVLESSAAISANATNGGTAPLAFNTPYETATGSAAFALQGTTTCADGATLNPGANCNVAAIFNPQAAGTQTETLSFSSNALNSATLEFTGTGASLTKSTLVIAVTSPTGALTYGQAITVGATLTPAAGGVGTPTGTVTFYVDTVPQTPVTLANNSASITLPILTGGAHVLSASYSGNSDYASAASANLDINIAVAATSTTTVVITASPTLWSNPTAANIGESVTLSAAVSPSGAGTPTGTISFLSGTAVLGAGAVSAQGLASFTTTGLAAGNYSITAVYSGDANFNGSSSASAVPLLISAPTITMSASTPNITGNGPPVTLTFGAIAGFGVVQGGPSTVSLACSGLPKYAVCAFQPAFVDISLVQTAQLTVLVNQPPPIIPSQSGLGGLPVIAGRPGLSAALALCLLIPALILGYATRRSRNGYLKMMRVTLAVLLLLGGCVAGTSGCSSSGSSTFTTPKGSSTFTVTATITPGSATTTPPPTQTMQFTLTVN